MVQDAFTTPSEHVDVLVVGAGISGIGAGYHLNTMCPSRTYAILEGRADIGGTWDLFRYPGVRSDSDMHTLGFRFKPWTEAKAIADGSDILRYLHNTMNEFDIARHIRFGHLVKTAQWSSETSQWTVHVERVGTGDIVTFTCGFLFMCSGYYSYREGYTPEFAGRDRFRGEVVHPQKWTSDVSYSGKRVVVVGSGATAITLVPAMAKEAEHVTMLQRSPTYIAARPDVDAFANKLRKYLPAKIAYAITRLKNTKYQQLVYSRSRTHPDKVKEILLKGVREQLGPDYDIEKNFTPTYNPWDQRLCLAPNGDLFQAMREGKASVVTDTIDTFDETGILLSSGQHLDADVIVTATGLQLVTLGEVQFEVDGKPIDFAETWTYKGVAYSGVPNLASSFGYINASWTLRSDLTCEYVCRLLNHMAKTGTTQCTPQLRDEDLNMPERPWIDSFSAGYMSRVMHMFPRQGNHAPWVNPQNFARDKKMFRRAPLDDGAMQFTRPVN
ncbi:NAD(P)/FAD-dependent oxidoreductase [bacterium]|nr:NAD(P)/FAD-dependent oxidoreductase [bacterium]